MTSLLQYEKEFLGSIIRSTQRSAFLENLTIEVKSICELSPTNSVQSYYVTEDENILHFPSVCFSKYPALKKLLGHVNEKLNSSLNACVVNEYCAGQARKTPHADNESYVDQTYPISTFTIGVPREVYFYEVKEGSPRLNLIQQLKPVEGSLYTMMPTFQSTYKHQVQPGGNARISISFRRVRKLETPNPNEWPFNIIKTKRPSVHRESVSSPSLSMLNQSNSSGTLDNTNNFSSVQPGQSSQHSVPETNLAINHDEMTSQTHEVSESAIPEPLATQFLDSVMKSIKSLNKIDCKKLIVCLNNRINEIEKSEFKIEPEVVDSYVEYIEDPLERVLDSADSKQTLINTVFQHLPSLDLPSSTSPTTLWLLENPSLTPFLEGRNISETPGIKEILESVRKLDDSMEGLNSCLLTLYPNGNSLSRVHSDKAAYLCDDSPICNFSLGDSRSISFFNAKLHASPPLKTFTMASASLLVMKPGCQDKFKHSLIRDPSKDNTRLCLSFRKVKPLTAQSESSPSESPTEPPATILIGTSITKRIQPSKIVGKATAKFFNCSTSGENITKAS